MENESERADREGCTEETAKRKKGRVGEREAEERQGEGLNFRVQTSKSLNWRKLLTIPLVAYPVSCFSLYLCFVEGTIAVLLEYSTALEARFLFLSLSKAYLTKLSRII